MVAFSPPSLRICTRQTGAATSAASPRAATGKAIIEARAPGSAFTPSAEQQAEIDAFQRKSTETKAQLKELRRTLRLETDRLELVTKVANIALMPAVVAFAGLGLFAIRRRRLGRCGGAGGTPAGSTIVARTGGAGHAAALSSTVGVRIR